MTQTYFWMLTLLGKAKTAAAIASGTNIDLTYVAVGDADYMPSEGQTALVSEKFRAQANMVYRDAPANPNIVVVELVIPSSAGGWYVREGGIFDAAGDLFAIGKLPATYKPTFAEGAGKELHVKALMEVSSQADVSLKIDPTVVMATRAYVDSEIAAHEAKSPAHPAAKVSYDPSMSGMAATTVQAALDELDGRFEQLDKSVAGGVDVTLTATENRYGILNLTGTLTADINVVVNPDKRTRIVSNNTTGAYSLRVKTAAGRACQIPRGQVSVWCDGTDCWNLDNMRGVLSNRTVITASGSWTVPAGIKRCKATIVGGGGGGAGVGTTNIAAGSGGGGGGAAVVWENNLTPGAVINAVIGAGGAAGPNNNSNGGTGGTSSLALPSGSVSATGGDGGVALDSGPVNGHRGGSGGYGSGGILNMPGERGGSSLIMSASEAEGGPGGNSLLGLGGAGGRINSGTPSGGTAGTGYGAGGGGGTARAGLNYAGGSGTAGAILIEW